MVSLKSALAFFVVLAFAGAVAPVIAQEQTVTVTASRTACEGVSPSESSRLAREAEKNGEYQRASVCYVVAGEYSRAHRASNRATGEAAAMARRNASTAAANAKTQMARLRAAFR